MIIVFIVVCHFPYGNASSIRALNICHLLHDAGHTVHVISDFDSLSGCGCKNAFCSYESIFEQQPTFLHRHEVPKASVAALKRYCDNNSVDAVLINARYDRFDKISSFCHKRYLKLYVENCEWYHYSNYRLKFLDYRYWLNEKMIRYSLKEADGFISISRFLDKHNKHFGRPSVRIPTIMDVINSKYRISSSNTGCYNSKISCIYTGNPGISKELLKPIIQALAENSYLCDKFVFHIYGPDEYTVLRNIGNDNLMLDAAGNSVVIHGKVPQDEMQNVMLNADYLMFIRPDRRSSQSGFPTKLGESMNGRNTCYSKRYRGYWIVFKR